MQAEYSKQAVHSVCVHKGHRSSQKTNKLISIHDKFSDEQQQQQRKKKFIERERENKL